MKSLLTYYIDIKQAQLALIMTLTSMKILTNMAQLQYHPW